MVNVSFNKQPKYNSFGKFLILGKLIWTVIFNSSTFSWLLCLKINFPSNVSILFFFLFELGSKSTLNCSVFPGWIKNLFFEIENGASALISKSASNKEAFLIVNILNIVSLSWSSSFL